MPRGELPDVCVSKNVPYSLSSATTGLYRTRIPWPQAIIFLTFDPTVFSAWFEIRKWLGALLAEKSQQMTNNRLAFKKGSGFQSPCTKPSLCQKERQEPERIIRDASRFSPVQGVTSAGKLSHHNVLHSLLSKATRDEKTRELHVCV